MASSPSPRVVLLTPPGRGAVATLAMVGPGSVELVDRLLAARSGRPLAETPTERIVVGSFAVSDRAAEPVVARRVDGERVDLHCHGGTASVAAIQQALAARGAEVAAWRQWIRQFQGATAGLSSSAEDTVQQANRGTRQFGSAAALVALAEATTERTAGILLDQYNGALGRAWDEILAALARGDAAAAQTQIQTLLDRAPLGRHLVEPWKVVLVGRPNVGKSSLVNAMLGHPRAIVHSSPGTTRDVLATRTATDGWPVELCDTAGLRRGANPIERAGSRRARAHAARADLVLLVLDASRPRFPRLTPRPSWNQTLVVWNKCDLAKPPSGGPAGLATVATTGEGIPELLRAIAQRLVPSPPPPGSPVPWSEEQIALLGATLAELSSADGQAG